MTCSDPVGPRYQLTFTTPDEDIADAEVQCSPFSAVFFRSAVGVCGTCIGNVTFTVTE
jgi:hypothetical protein